MSTRTTLRTSLKVRLGDPTNAVWSDADLNGYLDTAVTSLYPAFHQKKVGQTLAGPGPLQPTPPGARDIYSVGMVRPGSTRVRPIRRWTEGLGNASVGNLGIEGNILVWSWTEGFDAPTIDAERLMTPPEADEVILLKSHITALEGLYSNRAKANRYISIQVREGVTEDDIAQLIDALHATLRDYLSIRPALPSQGAAKA